jgi:hypothetical protein
MQTFTVTFKNGWDSTPVHPLAVVATTPSKAIAAGQKDVAKSVGCKTKFIKFVRMEALGRAVIDK